MIISNKIQYRNVLVLLLFMVVTSYGYTQKKLRIRGSKNVIEKKEDLATFSSIELRDDLEINLLRSDVAGYKIQGDDNIVDVIKFVVKNNTLVISTPYRIGVKKTLVIDVYYTNINKISATNGKIVSQNRIMSDSLEISANNTAKLILTLGAKHIKASLKQNSSGKFNFKTNDLSFNLFHRVDAVAYVVADSIAVTMEGNTEVKLNGQVKYMNTEMMETSTMRARDLKTDVIRVKASGLSNVQLNAITALEVDISGSSKVAVYGEPKIDLVNFKGKAQLLKKE